MAQVSRTQRLIVVLVLNLGLVAALVIVGITAHSLAVLAEGGGYLLDAAGVAVALLAIRLSARPASRAGPAPTDIAALVNCGWLLALEILIVGAAAERLLTRTPQVRGLPVRGILGRSEVVKSSAPARSSALLTMRRQSTQPSSRDSPTRKQAEGSSSATRSVTDESHPSSARLQSMPSDISPR